jgi:histone-lysine N-methyltransferase EZH2
MKPPALLSGNNSRGSTDESDQSMQKDASHAHKQHDTNFLQKVKDDDSCFQGAENIMNKLKNKRSCSPGCGKPGAVHNDEHVVFNGSEQMLIQKLMPMMGNNPCILAAALNTRTCSEIYRFLDQEKAKSSKIGIVASEWHLDFPTGASNRPRRLDRETLKRTRTIMAKNVASRVQYQPCNHEGDCDPSNCSCMKRDHCCERACSCSSNCPNRFQGCRCSLGNCRTNACPCFIAARECDPDLCGNCGASDIPLLMQDPNQCTKSASELGICHNVNLLRKIHKKVAMSYSTTHGWGLFACENIKKGEFIYEYTGAMISHDEAERRGTIYDKIQISFLFELNEESVVDATRKGNKWKFANHQTIGPNCKAKTFRLRGEHRIGIWALQDILKNEELFFDYGYNGESAPDWSKIRIRTS